MLVIPAIACENGDTARTEPEKAHEFGIVWSRTFAKVDKVPTAASNFLKRQGTKWHLNHIPPPGVHDFVVFMRALKDSAPGRDGIPLSCYKALIGISALIFFNANLILLQGGLLG